LYGLAGLVGDAGAAEDVTQEALLRAWRDLPRLRDPDRFDAWLRRLVVNAAHDEGRRRRRRGSPVPIEQAPEPRMEDGVAALAQRDELAAGLRNLSAVERSVLALRYYLDLSTADAARTMGVGEIAYRSRVHRALRKLRDAVGSAGAADGMAVGRRPATD
jgi:RNA polymerase sigma-70 factor (ECF subfamily)